MLWTGDLHPSLVQGSVEWLYLCYIVCIDYSSYSSYVTIRKQKQVLSFDLKFEFYVLELPLRLDVASRTLFSKMNYCLINLIK